MLFYPGWWILSVASLCSSFLLSSSSKSCWFYSIRYQLLISTFLFLALKDRPGQIEEICHQIFHFRLSSCHFLSCLQSHFWTSVALLLKSYQFQVLCEVHLHPHHRPWSWLTSRWYLWREWSPRCCLEWDCCSWIHAFTFARLRVGSLLVWVFYYLECSFSTLISHTISTDSDFQLFGQVLYYKHQWMNSLSS